MFAHLGSFVWKKMAPEYVGTMSENRSDHIALGRKERQYKCGACTRAFKRPQDLERHVQGLHVGNGQVMGYAIKVGFEVGELADPPVWMSGPSGAVDQQALPSKLVE